MTDAMAEFHAYYGDFAHGTAQQCRLINVPLRALAHVETRTLHGEHYQHELVRSFRGESGRTVPPILLWTRGPSDPLSLSDGNHRLAAARDAEVAAVSAFVIVADECPGIGMLRSAGFTIQ